MSYQVKTDTFEGPLGLLLHLVSKDRVEASDVCLAQITEDYLGALDRMEELNLSVTTEFLVVAATLLELKSARLLPARGPVDPELAGLLEERDVLLSRLVQYATFKRVTTMFSESLREHEGFVARQVAPEPELMKAVPDLLQKTSPQRLAHLAARALAPERLAPAVDTSHLPAAGVSVSEVAQAIRQVLRTRLVARLAEFRGASRLDTVASFLAVLELYKNNYVHIEQDAPFGEVFLRRRDPDFAAREFEGQDAGRRVLTP